MRMSIQALMALAVWAGVTKAQVGNARADCLATEGDIYGYSLQELTGETFSMEEYRGKVTLIFNSATFWGMNYQYVDWSAIKEDINDENFDILAIPTSHFNLQEPGKNEEIMNLLEFVRPGNGFVPNYRVAAKSEVNGGNQLDLYTFLKETCPGPTDMLGAIERFFWTPIKQSDITWNFEKILVSAEGKPVRRYNPVTSPYNVQEDIQEQLDLLKASKTENVKKLRVLQGSVKKNNKTKP